jgi:hypothetical protein
LRRLYIDAFGFEPGTESLPVRGCGHQYYPLPVGDCGRCEATDSTIKEFFILVELNNMIGGGGVVKKMSPWFLSFVGASMG